MNLLHYAIQIMSEMLTVNSDLGHYRLISAPIRLVQNSVTGVKK